MAYRGGVANVHSDSFLLVLILAWGAVVLLVFLAALGFAVFRRLRGASIGPVLSGILALVGGACLGLLVLDPAHEVALATFGAAAALAIFRWRAGRRAQAGWLLVGTGLSPTLLWAGVVLDVGLSETIIDLRAGLWLGVAVAAMLAGIAVVVRGDEPTPGSAHAATVGLP